MKAYVYSITVDGVVRYIGKGNGNRKNVHIKKVRSLARRRAAGETVFATHFYNKLTRAWLDGADVSVNIVVDGLSDEAAFSLETKMIAEAPPEQLWNTAPGGHGFSVEQWNDPVFREKMLSREEAKRTEDYRTRRSAIAISTWADPEYRAKMIEKRRRRAEEQRQQREALRQAKLKDKKWYPYGSWNEFQKIRAEERKREGDERVKAGLRRADGKPVDTSTRFTPATRPPNTPETNAKIAASNQETWNDPKLLSEQAERSKIIWLRPDYRARLTGRKWTLEMRAALSAKRKAQWADPEFRAKMEAAQNNPAEHTRRSEATLRGWQKRRAKNK